MKARHRSTSLEFTIPQLTNGKRDTACPVIQHHHPYKHSQLPSEACVSHCLFSASICAFFSGNMGVSLMLYMYVSVSLSYLTIHLSIHISISLSLLSILDNIYISTLLNETKDCMLDLPQTNYTPCLTHYREISVANSRRSGRGEAGFMSAETPKMAKANFQLDVILINNCIFEG